MEDHLVSPVPTEGAKTAPLEGVALDAAVAKAEGLAFVVEKHLTNPPTPMACWVMVDGKPDFASGPYAPSTRWDHGGPIIERDRIWLTAWPNSDQWSADVPGEPGDPMTPPTDGAYGSPGHVAGTGMGPTPLIAAMRAFVHAAEVKAQTPKAET